VESAVFVDSEDADVVGRAAAEPVKRDYLAGGGQSRDIKDLAAEDGGSVVGVVLDDFVEELERHSLAARREEWAVR
jgi:hypothetical protein